MSSGLEWYSLQIALPDTTVIFNAFFSVDSASHIVQSIYDTTNPTVDIRSTGNNGGPTYLYYPGWLCFDGGGCNVTRFPYYYGATVGDYNMYGDTNSNSGNLGDYSPLIYTFASISGPLVCFKEGTEILTDQGYRPIETLRMGDQIKTVDHGFKSIAMIGFRSMIHSASKERIKDQLYVCRSDRYPEVIEDLVITGCHSILTKQFAEGEREKTQEVLGDIYVTDNHYRLPACVDQRAAVYEYPGMYNIYHIALENDDYYMNYGIYANGLLVETSSKRYMKELSNMTLLE